MKYIKLVPGKVKLVNLANGRNMLDGEGNEMEQSHLDFYRDRLCDPIFGMNATNIRSQDKIAHRLDDAESEGAEWLELEDADYKLLFQSCESPHPQRPHDSRYVRCQIRYLDATAKVQSEDPRKKKTSEEKEEGGQGDSEAA